jgi:hypothetical protein
MVGGSEAARTDFSRTRSWTSDGSVIPLAWSVKREQLQEQQVRQLEEQPWRQMAEVATCKCNQAEGKAHKQQAKL